ncbi:MAG: YbaB/EbfC family nucleoid-associated protein [Clostridia bacterium]|jgi:DNA-binding YbaB/EbfC family protein|nr:YbaB/EbfC family nucleoid-associated protein [Clostridiaceae bacterium]
MARGRMSNFGGSNMNNLMKQAKKMQQDMQQAQEELEAKTFEATVGGGMVTVVANGKREILEVNIQPDAIDPDDVEMLQDMIVAAVNEVLRKIDDAAQSIMGKFTGGFGLPGMF